MTNVIKTSLIKGFRGTINVVNLIGELSIKQSGKFDRNRGIRRATRLAKMLEESTNKALVNNKVTKTKLVGSRQYTFIDNADERLALAEHYFDSEEVRRLCSVSDMQTQRVTLEYLRKRMSKVVYPKKKYVNSRAKAIAKLQASQKAANLAEIKIPTIVKPAPKAAVIKPVLPGTPCNKFIAAALILADRDMGSDVVMHADYMLVPDGENLIRISNSIYVEAGRYINDLTGDARRALRGQGKGRFAYTGAESIDFSSQDVVQYSEDGRHDSRDVWEQIAEVESEIGGSYGEIAL